MAALIRTARGPVEVADEGSGPALLVVHGMPGDWRQAATVSEDLADRARILRVSRPGYGRTPLRSGRTPAEQADLWAALLDSLGIERAVVLGISGGGPSSYAFAARHPSRCDGLVLCCAVAAHVIEVPVGMRRLAAVPGLWPALAALHRRRAKARPPRPSEDDLTSTERALLADPRTRAAFDRFVADTPSWTSGVGLRNDARQLTAGAVEPLTTPVPTVVLHGSADTVVPLANAEAYAALTGAQVEVLDDLGHVLPLFARQRLTERLTALLATSSEAHQSQAQG